MKNRRKYLRNTVWTVLLALVLVFQSFGFVQTAYALGEGCMITGCSCTSCSWRYIYPDANETKHFTHVQCTGCSASYGLEWEGHSFSGNTCTVCGYTKSGGGGPVDPGCSHGSYRYIYSQYDGSRHYCVQVCSYCGVQMNAWPESHSLSSTCSYLNASYHTYSNYCAVCGYSGTSGQQPHTWSNSYRQYNTQQHRIDQVCTGCGHSTSTYAAHADSNGDGRCDSCGYSISVTVTWNASANGGTVNGQSSVTTSVTSGSVATAPNYTPAKTGYIFKGWYTAASGGSLYSSVSVTSARTFYAQFTPATYTITWNLGDGRTETTSQAYGEKLTLPTPPTRAGYTFVGWYTASTGGSQVTSSTVYQSQGPTTYYARWTAKSYTITWDLGDGKTETTQQTYGAKLVLPEEPSRSGYTFAGWFTSSTGGTQITTSTTYTTAGASTYYARWTGNAYTITWDLGDGKTETTSQIYGKNLTLPVAPTKVGHTFMGWYTAKTGGTQVTDNTIYQTQGPSTFYAQWEARSYNITWDLGDGKTETTQQTYGESLKLPSNPAKDGYTFDGWYTEETGGTEVTEDTIYTADGPCTYYARWTKVQVFSVTVPAVLPLAMGEDGRVHTSEASIINHSTGAVRVSSITAATRNGWKLVSWDTDMAREKVDTHLIGFSLNGTETTGKGNSEELSLTGDWTIPLDGSLPLRYDAVISALSQPVTDQAVLSVVFVLEWA